MRGNVPQVVYRAAGSEEIPWMPVCRVRMSQQTSVRLFLDPKFQAEFSIENWPASLRLPVAGDRVVFDDVLYEITGVEFTISERVNLVDLYGIVLDDYTEDDGDV